MGNDLFNYDEFFTIRKFLGQNPAPWISLMEEDIKELEIPLAKQVSYTTQFMFGIAHQWLRKNLHRVSMMDWGEFSDSILLEFSNSRCVEDDKKEAIMVVDIEHKQEEEKGFVDGIESVFDFEHMNTKRTEVNFIEMDSGSWEKEDLSVGLPNPHRVTAEDWLDSLEGEGETYVVSSMPEIEIETSFAADLDALIDPFQLLWKEMMEQMEQSKKEFRYGSRVFSCVLAVNVFDEMIEKECVSIFYGGIPANAGLQKTSLYYSLSCIDVGCQSSLIALDLNVQNLPHIIWEPGDKAVSGVWGFVVQVSGSNFASTAVQEATITGDLVHYRRPQIKVMLGSVVTSHSPYYGFNRLPPWPDFWDSWFTFVWTRARICASCPTIFEMPFQIKTRNQISCSHIQLNWLFILKPQLVPLFFSSTHLSCQGTGIATEEVVFSEEHAPTIYMWESDYREKNCIPTDYGSSGFSNDQVGSSMWDFGAKTRSFTHNRNNVKHAGCSSLIWDLSCDNIHVLIIIIRNVTHLGGVTHVREPVMTFMNDQYCWEAGTNYFTSSFCGERLILIPVYEWSVQYTRSRSAYSSAMSKVRAIVASSLISIFVSNVNFSVGWLLLKNLLSEKTKLYGYTIAMVSVQISLWLHDCSNKISEVLASYCFDSGIDHVRTGNPSEQHHSACFIYSSIVPMLWREPILDIFLFFATTKKCCAVYFKDKGSSYWCSMEQVFHSFTATLLMGCYIRVYYGPPDGDINFTILARSQWMILVHLIDPRCLVYTCSCCVTEESNIWRLLTLSASNLTGFEMGLYIEYFLVFINCPGSHCELIKETFLDALAVPEYLFSTVLSKTSEFLSATLRSVLQTLSLTSSRYQKQKQLQQASDFVAVSRMGHLPCQHATVPCSFPVRDFKVQNNGKRIIGKKASDTLVELVQGDMNAIEVLSSSSKILVHKAIGNWSFDPGIFPDSKPMLKTKVPSFDIPGVLFFDNGISNDNYVSSFRIMAALSVSESSNAVLPWVYEALCYDPFKRVFKVGFISWTDQQKLFNFMFDFTRDTDSSSGVLSMIFSPSTIVISYDCLSMDHSNHVGRKFHSRVDPAFSVSWGSLSASVFGQLVFFVCTWYLGEHGGSTIHFPLRTWDVSHVLTDSKILEDSLGQHAFLNVFAYKVAPGHWLISNINRAGFLPHHMEASTCTPDCLMLLEEYLLCFHLVKDPLIAWRADMIIFYGEELCSEEGDTEDHIMTEPIHSLWILSRVDSSHYLDFILEDKYVFKEGKCHDQFSLTTKPSH